MYTKTFVRLTAAVLLLAACSSGPAATSATPSSAAGTAAATASASATPRPVQKIDFQLSFLPLPQNVAYYVAQAKGFYREQGLDVNILRGNGSGATANSVDQGQVLIGEADMPTVVVARNQGQKVKAFMLMVDSTPQAFAAIDPAIKSPKDFEGRTVGVASGSGDANLLPVLVKAAGGDPAKVKVQNLAAGVYNSALLNGQVDVVPAYTNGGFISLKMQADVAGKSVHAIASRDFNLDIYQLCLIASDKTIDQQPDLVRSFALGTVKGLRYAVQNPTEAVQILTAAIPTLDPNATPLQVAEVIKVVDTSAFRSNGFGVADQAKLTKTRDVVLQAYGVTATIPASDLYTDKFLK